MRIELSEKILREFAVCVEKTFSKPKQVCVVGDGSLLHFYVSQDEHQVSFESAYAGKPFEVAVEASRFIAAVKQAYEDAVALDFAVKAVTLEYGSVKVKLPYQVLDRKWRDSEQQAFATPEGFLEALTHVAFVPSTDIRFSGILLDPVEDGSVLARFSGTALALMKIDTKFTGRFVISSDFSSLAKSKIEFPNLLISERSFGVRSSEGVSISSSFMADTYPEAYFESFELQTLGPLIDPLKFDLCYTVDSTSFKNAVSLVSSVVGEDDQRMYFTMEGSELSISSKSYKGLKANETVHVSGIPREEPKPFILHKKTLLKALDNHKDEMYVIDCKNAVYLCDQTCKSVSVLVKLS